jgi:hypothetical protein
MSVTAANAFGFYTGETYRPMMEDPFELVGINQYRLADPKKYAAKHNIRKIIGYIPIIGTIIGMVSLILLSKETGDLNSYRKGWAIRVIIETTSLGFLLLIPDLIVTYKRSHNL